MKLTRIVEGQDADGNRGYNSIEVEIEDCDTEEIKRQIQEYYDENGFIPKTLNVFLDDEEGESHEIELDSSELITYSKNLIK